MPEQLALPKDQEAEKTASSGEQDLTDKLHNLSPPDMSPLLLEATYSSFENLDQALMHKSVSNPDQAVTQFVKDPRQVRTQEPPQIKLTGRERFLSPHPLS